MMSPISRIRSVLGCVLALLVGSVAVNVAREVTFDRLRAADSEPENWLVYGGTYRSLRYSPLDQINAANVHTLKAAWAFQLGVVDNGLQSTPLVADGVMYVIGSGNRVFALDATNGRRLWHYFYEPQARPQTSGQAPAPAAAPSPAAAPPPAPPPAPPNLTNRGLALAHGHLYFGTQDNFVVALDATDGKELWRTNVEDSQIFGCRINGAPLVVNDLVVVGSTGGDAAHRGHLVAFDGKTGQRRWRFNIIPGPGEKGNETWAGDSWVFGGGAAWLTGSYDPDLDLIYWGTGNASSDFYGDQRKGDNLYTSSIVALKAATGEIAWHFQTVPPYECILVDLPVSGRPRKLLIQPNKSGYVIVLDRTNGEFIAGWKYVENVTWSSGLDSRGVPQNRREPEVGKATLICPNLFGARGFNQATFNPKTGLLYNNGIEWCGEVTARAQELVPGKTWLAGTFRMLPPPSGKVTSHLDAFEPLTGRTVWRLDTKHPLLAALMSTGGDLIFTGDPEGNFFALNARTGQKLWSFPTGSGHRGGPISYAVNGKQYIATPSGWGSGLAGRLPEFFPELEAIQRGATVFAFTLPDDAKNSR
jgi:alcohol dehydrogenase (cytochrome c)